MALGAGEGVSFAALSCFFGGGYLPAAPGEILAPYQPQVHQAAAREHPILFGEDNAALMTLMTVKHLSANRPRPALPRPGPTADQPHDVSMAPS